MLHLHSTTMRCATNALMSSAGAVETNSSGNMKPALATALHAPGCCTGAGEGSIAGGDITFALAAMAAAFWAHLHTTHDGRGRGGCTQGVVAISQLECRQAGSNTKFNPRVASRMPSIPFACFNSPS